MTNAKLFAGTIACLFVIYCVIEMVVRVTPIIWDAVSRGFFV